MGIKGPATLLMLGVLWLSGHASDAAGPPHQVVHNETEFISAVRNTSVTSILVSSCYLYLPSRVWLATGGLVLVGERQLSVARSPELLCRPILDFNYAFGIFSVTGNGTLTFSGIQISKVQRLVPNGLLHTPLPDLECGTVILQDSVLHNEMSAPLDKSALFFNNVPRPERYTGDQIYTGFPEGWCDPTSMIAPGSASFVTWTRGPPFLDLSKQQPATSTSDAHRLLSEEVQRAMDLPHLQHRRLLGMQMRGVLGTSSTPLMRNTSVVLASNVTNGHPCYLWAALATDVRMKMPSTPDGVGGCYEQWIDTTFVANTNFPASCLENNTTPICIKIWQGMLTANISDPPQSLISQLINPVAAAPEPAQQASGSSKVSHRQLAWIIPVVVVATAFLVALAARRAWLATHTRDAADLEKQAAESNSEVTSKGFWDSVGSSITAATHSMALLIARAPGGIRLGPLIGAGSFGRVYLGTWQDRTVAVKVIVHTAAETKRIQNELEVATMIKHKNCVECLFTEATTSALAQSLTMKGNNNWPQQQQQQPAAGLLASSTCPSSGSTSTSTGSDPSHPASSSSGACAKLVIAGQSGPITPLPTSLTGSACGSNGSATKPTCDKQRLLSHEVPFNDAAAITDQDMCASHLNDSAMPLAAPTAQSSRVINNKKPFFRISGSSSLLTDTISGAGVGGCALNPLQGIKTSESWVVMEHCDGGSLSSAVQGGLFDNEDSSKHMVAVLQAASDVAQGMDALHKMHIIHGDLKCDNVLLQSVTGYADTDQQCMFGAPAPVRWVAKVADFGMSRILGADHTHMSTRACGTVTHCAPEYLRYGHLSAASDVYSYGVLLYELATGQHAFAGQLHGGVVHAVTVAQARPVWPSHGPFIPDEYKDLAQACWATLPSERPTFAEVIERLDAMLMGVVPCAPVARNHPALLPFSLLASESTNLAQSEGAHTLAAAMHAGFVSAAHAASSSYSVQAGTLRDDPHLSGSLHNTYHSGSFLMGPVSATGVGPAIAHAPSQPCNLAAAAIVMSPVSVTPAVTGLNNSLAVCGLVTVLEGEAEGCCTSSSLGTGAHGQEGVGTLDA